jgi:hypothetical protein
MEIKQATVIIQGFGGEFFFFFPSINSSLIL